MSEAQYVIGIDLGTTNSAVAYCAVEDASSAPCALAIPQISSPGTEEALPTLPSFLYLPTLGELQSQTFAPSWSPEREVSVGRAARDRGAEVPGRLVSSAKSWLSYSAVDRRSALLPVEADEGVQRVSPVEACCQYLTHLREVWDQEHPEAPFVEQQVLITVPASFDPSARQFVQEAAEAAGYPESVLLEEPQAAFYSWLERRGDEWRKELSVDDQVLVVDIGGGTTDFSLIKVIDQDGDLALERVAVGAHLLLGGDNMDLALAYLARGKLEEEGHDIDDWQMQSLVHQCRSAKEQFLGEQPPEQVELTLVGRGSGLVAGTIQTTLELEEVRTTLVEGFVPLVDSEQVAEDTQRGGLQQVGLPYASDARVSAQLARFLHRGGEGWVTPTAVLYNGGTLKAHALRQQITDQLNQWAEEKGAEPVRVLDGADLDHAVSRGAACYGMARRGQGVRIRGGTSHSYYIGVEGSAPAVPGIPPPVQAVCVVPFGMEEGTETELLDQEFSLVVGEKAAFRFFRYDQELLPDGCEAEFGRSVRQWKKWFEELEPVETVLEADDGQSSVVRVRLQAKVTELGVLELWCVSEERSWKLQFDLREQAEAVLV